ncbi:hypothetical protein [Mycobacterium seoulense]|uniref:hypothetical protein n=1 Tax=Mycobacterium seoulense TaxID=386911 RepID=UPI003CE865AD
MEPEIRAGLQTALAQLVMALTLDYDDAKALHDEAVENGQTWPVTRALLFMAEKAWRAYFRATDRTNDDLIAALRADIANLARMDP